MTASTPPSAHEEIDFLDRIERELIALTTAELEGIASLMPTSTPTPKSVMLATGEPDSPTEAGTHTTPAANDEITVVATQKSYGPSPSRG
jgi:hypothetical protein